MIRDQIIAKLENISLTLKENLNKEHNVGCLSGGAGIALFFYYYYEYSTDEKYYSTGASAIEGCLKKIKNSNRELSYCSGLAGFGWVLAHLKGRGSISLEEDFLIEIDTIIYKILGVELKKNNFDFLYGCIGYGYYLLKRYQTADNRSEIGRYLELILDNLRIYSEKEGESLKFREKFTYDKERYNLGLSHGMSAILNFTTRLCAFNRFQFRAQKISDGVKNYLLSNMKESKNSSSFFPNTVALNGEKSGNSRLAWCYGDLGVAVSLWNYSKTTNDDELANTSLKILKETTLRKSKETTKVVDYTLCHGSFGIAQIYKYMYDQTQLKIFNQASSFWIKDGMDRCQEGLGLSGFQYRSDIPGEWESSLGILKGISGIGLALISNLSEKSLSWDECLMISNYE